MNQTRTAVDKIYVPFSPYKSLTKIFEYGKIKTLSDGRAEYDR